MSTRRTSISAFLDTSAFIPLLDEANVLHAKLVQHLSAAKAFVGIDTVVLSEFLVGMADAFEREAVAEKCTRQFRVYSFDTQTAVVCAELFKILKGKGQIPKTPTKRQLTKVDVMIMASAIVSGASEFIFEDGHFANYPALFPEFVCGRPLPSFVRASNLPSVAVQENLPDFDGSDKPIP